MFVRLKSNQGTIFKLIIIQGKLIKILIPYHDIFKKNTKNMLFFKSKISESYIAYSH